MEADNKQCDNRHYYSEEAGYCVSYEWCPKWFECVSGSKWDQEQCECVGSEKLDKILLRESWPNTTHPVIASTLVTPVVKDCEDEFRWDENLGFCIEKFTTRKPSCPAGKEWSDKEFTCIWKKNKCGRVQCTDTKIGRWYKNACRCFTDKAWCRIQSCPPKTQGFLLRHSKTCKCYTLQDSCLRKDCGQKKTPGFFHGRCACYSKVGMCKMRDCPPGKRGYFHKNEKCHCHSKQEECSRKSCDIGKVGFFWDGRCKCKSKEWICGLKKCG